MHPPTRRSGGPKRAHILSQNERGQYIPYPRDQIGPNASGLIIFNEALQASMTHGTDNHLFIVYGKAVHIARGFLMIWTKARNALVFPSFRFILSV